MKKEYIGKYNVYTSTNHRFGTDAVLLSYFANAKSSKRAFDLGCGCGIIPFLLLRDNEKLKITAVDIQSEAVELVKKAVAEQSVENSIFPLECDLKALPKSFNGCFDLVTMNPPYKRVGAGKITGNDALDIARNEIECTIEDICAAAARLLIPKGRFCICQRPERITDVVCAMRENGIEPKIYRNVINKSGDKPMLVLIQGQRGGLSGSIMQNDLILKQKNGEDTAEIKEIYRVIRERNNG